MDRVFKVNPTGSQVVYYNIEISILIQKIVWYQFLLFAYVLITPKNLRPWITGTTTSSLYANNKTSDQTLDAITASFRFCVLWRDQHITSGSIACFVKSSSILTGLTCFTAFSFEDKYPRGIFFNLQLPPWVS